MRGWLAALVVAVGVYVVLAVARRLLLRHLGALADRTRNTLDDGIAEVASHTRYFFLAFTALYAGSLVLVLPVRAETAIRTIGVVVLALQAALWVNAIIGALIARRIRRDADEESATTVSLVGFGLRRSPGRF